MKRTKPLFRDRIETIVGEASRIKGSLYVTGSLRIEGIIEGDVKASGDIYVGESGLVVGNIEARNIIISGEINGDLDAMDRVEIVATGKLYGDLLALEVKIEEGGFHRGSSNVRGELYRGEN